MGSNGRVNGRVNGRRRPMARVVMVSGGMASYEAARRVVRRYRKRNVYLWFADTMMEDNDLYRFLDDIEARLGLPIERMADGRTPWEVFKDERFIGNSRVDPCSKILKRHFLRRQLKDRFPDQPVTVYLGFDWMERHRIEAAGPFWESQGYELDFPLCWEPMLFPDDYPKLLSRHGLEPPRLYGLGFAHNNCGGGCVKAGHKQWALLWQTLPDRFLWHEAQEEKMREFLGKDVAILKDRRGGDSKPLTLRAFRERLEAKARANGNGGLEFLNSLPDDGACSCFAVNPNTNGNRELISEESVVSA